MTWPPKGSKPPVPPRPAPTTGPRPEPLSPRPSPGETSGETKVKPQAKATTPTPPQFGHDGIDPRRAALILGLPLAATGVTLLVLFASSTVWWIAAGITAAGVTGGVLLRRSRKARGLLKRLPGAGRAASALRRMPSGRFARSPLGRVVNRALGRRPAASPGGASGGSPRGPKTLGGRLRSMLPAWAGGARGKTPGGSPGGSAGGRPGGRMRSLLGRLKPGGGRRPGSAGGASGGRLGKPAGASSGGSRTKPGSLLGRTASSVRNASRKASRAAASKLFRIRPAASSSGGRGSSKPSGKGKPSDGPGVADSARKKAHGIRGLVGDIAEAITEPTAGMTKDGFNTVKVRGNRDLTRPGTGPSWPTVDQDEFKPVPAPPVRTELDPEPEWPAEDPDEVPPSQSPKQSLPVERDHDPPPSPPVSPPSHREKPGETPRITSTNTTHGGKPVSTNVTSAPSSSAADTYVQMIDRSTPTSYASTCQDAAAQARRDSAAKEEDATRLRREAEDFAARTGAGNQRTARNLFAESAKCDEDAKDCLAWAGRLEGMANDAIAKAS